MFYSNNFIFDGISSQDYNIHLVTEESGVLNEYGVSYSSDSESTITLSFCLASDNGIPMVWEEEILSSVLGWLITDDYKPFISEDNEEVVFFLKGEEYTKRFTSQFAGMVDVTFKLLSNYGYKYYETKVIGNSGAIVENPSNINKPYKPVIEVRNIAGNTISISNDTLGKEPFTLSNLANGVDVFIDNEIGTITDSNNKNLLLNSNRKWIELAKGRNTITVEGSCEITIKSYFPVMV